MGWFKAVNTDGGKGIELKELLAWLNKTNSGLHTLKDAIRSLSV
tara:strand:- start:107 stop:238 length:132 start_codon:yes stop_codon:yes gene_type:complete